jgi:hypothetical protein
LEALRDGGVQYTIQPHQNYLEKSAS